MQTAIEQIQKNEEIRQNTAYDLKFRLTFKDFITFWTWPSIYSSFKTRMYHRVRKKFNNSNENIGKTLNPEKNRSKIPYKVPNRIRKTQITFIRPRSIRLVRTYTKTCSGRNGHVQAKRPEERPQGKE